jgi:hypothetical protein
VPEVKDESIVRHANKARTLGIQFLYLLNGRCDHLDFTDNKILRAFFSDLEWIVEEVRADCVIVADIRVARLIRSRYSSNALAIRVSTVAGVMRPNDLKPWLPFNIDGVVLHHDVGRDFELLENFAVFLRKNAPQAEIELLLNESCLYGCRTRDAHYARLAQARLGYVEGFQQNCNIPKYLDPSLILAARWIRPEDVDQYHELGIRRFKIAGREMSASWLERAVIAYMSGTYSGNLVDLFTMTPPGLDIAACDFVFIDNTALGDFLKDLKTWQGNEREFYRKWARELWEQGALKINDPGAGYDNSNASPRCIEPGEYLRKLVELKVYSDSAFHHGWSGPSKPIQIESSRTRASNNKRSFQ